MSEENQSGFKINDRRLFNPDGSLRDDAIIEEIAPEPVAPPPEPKQTFSGAELTGAKPAPPPPPPPPVAPPSPAGFAPMSGEVEDELAEGEAPDQTPFTEFLMRIASEAFIYLGLVAHPMTGRPQIDLPAAKEIIDMIVLLRQKTEGNLTGGEARFFEDLLADLQMQFVSLRQRQ